MNLIVFEELLRASVWGLMAVVFAVWQEEEEESHHPHQKSRPLFFFLARLVLGAKKLPAVCLVCR